MRYEFRNMNNSNSYIETSETEGNREIIPSKAEKTKNLWNKIDFWDKKTTTFLYSHEKLRSHRKWWKFISYMGDPREWLLIFVISGIYGLIVQDLSYFTIFFSGFFQSFAVYFLIKYTVKRPRPFKQDNSIIRLDSTGHGFSFPSGHCHHSTILFGLIILLWLPSWVFVLLFLFNLLIAFSRVMLGCHFISDTIVGVIEAYLELILFWMITKSFYLDILILVQNSIF